MASETGVVAVPPVPEADDGSGSTAAAPDAAPVCLDWTVLHLILVRLSTMYPSWWSDECIIASLCSCSCVSTAWRAACRAPELWENLTFTSGCLEGDGAARWRIAPGRRRQLTSSCFAALVKRSRGRLHTIAFSGLLWPSLSVSDVVNALSGYEGKLKAICAGGLTVRAARPRLVVRMLGSEKVIGRDIAAEDAAAALSRFLAPSGLLDVLRPKYGAMVPSTPTGYVRPPRLCDGRVPEPLPHAAADGAAAATDDEPATQRCGRLCSGENVVCETCCTAACGSCFALFVRGQTFFTGAPRCQHACRACFLDREPLRVPAGACGTPPAPPPPPPPPPPPEGLKDEEERPGGGSSGGGAATRPRPLSVEQANVLVETWDGGDGGPWAVPLPCDVCNAPFCHLCANLAEDAYTPSYCEKCNKLTCPSCCETDPPMICKNIDFECCNACFIDGGVIDICESCDEPFCAACLANGGGRTKMGRGAGGSVAAGKQQEQGQPGGGRRVGGTCEYCGRSVCWPCAQSKGLGWMEEVGEGTALGSAWCGDDGGGGDDGEASSRGLCAWCLQAGEEEEEEQEDDEEEEEDGSDSDSSEVKRLL